jgi:hypothetical protein
VTWLSTADSTAALQRGFGLTGWTITDLWVAVLGIGGELGRRDVEGITTGARSATRAEHDVMAAALNDYFTDRDLDHPIPFSHDLAADR